MEQSSSTKRLCPMDSGVGLCWLLSMNYLITATRNRSLGMDMLSLPPFQPVILLEEASIKQTMFLGMNGNLLERMDVAHKEVGEN
ncbi:hypothetical protein CEXT_412401 [Caerostris extrusa]|uniref:Uncharacterized protein n=1 Tax=Caerostris extrusa TaxID=172846 RepID=A0AAV4TJN4_CAEEX|nr:hypothetical protein CEXT_412401 [Caerostris extrusa]